ncbi:hypothetical protein [Streptomyces hoynatensis]|uniref:hypothetical protein n=1 Tax=Streptomyces hoynatensis TaxID=1141874 RepID=UPI00157762D8|nr:hypothetical protein [Streptomyces hoynatensis]
MVKTLGDIAWRFLREATGALEAHEAGAGARRAGPGAAPAGAKGRGEEPGAVDLQALADRVEELLHVLRAAANGGGPGPGTGPRS